MRTCILTAIILYFYPSKTHLSTYLYQHRDLIAKVGLLEKTRIEITMEGRVEEGLSTHGGSILTLKNKDGK